ncbi:MAG TPA: hypothetical protein VG096_04450 [Bryobacteraceae bacterium]|jgi:hypothetical protein|nr:hypothetical protein [Bryobacteraceae bacterium]
MQLPETVRVKLSSEEAGALSITPVVVQELSMRDLLELVLGATGKDEARIREILLRGSLVAGASRFRWPGWEPDLGGIRALLATFPDPDPSRPFAAERCIRAILRGGRQAVEVHREAASHKRPFHHDSFWDFMMEVTAAAEMHYCGYSYRDRADRYTRDFTGAEVDQIRAGSSRVKYSTLRDQILRSAFQHAELLVVRSVVPEP